MTSGLETEQALFYSSQGPHGGKNNKATHEIWIWMAD